MPMQISTILALEIYDTLCQVYMDCENSSFPPVNVENLKDSIKELSAVLNAEGEPVEVPWPDESSTEIMTSRLRAMGSRSRGNYSYLENLAHKNVRIRD